MLLYVQKTITTAKDTCEIPGDVTANDAVPAQLDSWKKIVGTHTQYRYIYLVFLWCQNRILDHPSD